MRTERRSTDPNDPGNWAMDCKFPGCGERFDPRLTVGDIAEHWKRHAGGKLENGTKVDPEKPMLQLVWIGIGQPPKGTPRWLQ